MCDQKVSTKSLESRFKIVLQKKEQFGSEHYFIHECYTKKSNLFLSLKPEFLNVLQKTEHFSSSKRQSTAISHLLPKSKHIYPLRRGASPSYKF